MKILLTFITVFFALNMISGQSAVIKGSITNEDNTPAEFANVLLFTIVDSTYQKGAIADFDGRYSFENIEKGHYYLTISQVGSDNLSSDEIKISSSEQKVEVPTMTFKQGVALDEVVVTAQKALFELDAEKIVVNVENSNLAVGNTALEVLQKSPGVLVDQDNRISLKGKQGVLVLIDGKNQYLTGDQLRSLLEGMPSSSIKKIEIIHNPSAKYEAEGNAGIINIELKRNENLGLNGSANISVGYGRNEKGSTGLNLNYRTEKVNIYGNYDYNLWVGKSITNIDRNVPFGNGVTRFEQESESDDNNHNHNFKFGADYTLSDKTTIGVLARGGIGIEDGGNINATNISGVKPHLFDRTTTNAIEMEDRNQLAGNFNIKHDFSETSELNFDIDYSKFKETEDVMYENYYYDLTQAEVAAPYFLHNESEVDIDIVAAKLDYSKSFSSGINLELGGKMSDVRTSNGTFFEERQVEEWIPDNSLTNTFQYNEQIYAGYMNMSKSIEKYSIQAGLRLEHTMSEGMSLTLDERVEREYTELFPSLSISRPFGEKHSLSFSYSRRLDRPNYRDLNPFIGFLDQFTFQKGNPFLNPQFTNSYGLNYSLGRSLFISANYSKTGDAMTQVLEQNDETQQTFQTNINFDKFSNYSLNLTAPIIIAEWWTSRLSFTGFINDYETVSAGENLSADQASYVMNVNNEFTINKKVNAEISGQYQSGVTYGIFSVRPQYFVDLGVSTKVMEGQGRLKLSVKDVFNIFENSVIAKSGSIDLKVRNKWESQRVHLSFTYNFGNDKVKAARNRKTANSEEERRVGS
ncbi:MAG: iron complex outermembrane receptor protein [Saprospiraceae bacterium]|jgi:iron complex outermembrane receptor protein